MKAIIFLLLIQTFCLAAGFSENLHWQDIGKPIPARADLDVRWDASMENFPSKVWIYRLLPNQFSPEVISNVAVLCSFMEKDKTGQSTNGITYQNSDGSRKLSFFFPSGDIHFEVPEPLDDPTNAFVGVPPQSQLPELAKNIFQKLRINFSDITGYFGTHKMEFDEAGTMYSIDHLAITNISRRTVYFRRTVDGMPIFGHVYGFDFGERGKITRLSIGWPKLERYMSYSTVSRKTIISFVHQGKAICGPVPDDVGELNWSTVKSVTIKKVLPSYFMEKTDRIVPFLDFDASIDTGQGSVVVGMACPIYDPTK
jgi:hypothetical protein